MRHRYLAAAAGAAALGAVSGLCAPSARAAEPQVLRFGNMVPSTAGQVVDIFEPWLDKVEKDSAGTVKFERFYGGSLVRSYAKQYEALLNGMQDGANIITSYTESLFPDFGLFSLPFMFQGAGAKEGAYAGWKLYEKGLIRGLDKVKVLAVFTNDNSGLHLAHEIKTLDDLQGLKVRAAGPGEADLIKITGATPVSLSISQVAESLHRKVIDGALNGWSALDTFKITPLTESHVDMPFGVRSFFLALNKEKYDALPPVARKAIDSNSGFDLSMKFGRYWEREGAKLREKLAKEHTVLAPKGEALKAWQVKFLHMQQAWIDEDKPHRQRMFDEAEKILAQLRAVRS
jgi:TRAP-type C4-dicarboxylate transport system substrate-binding protein